MTPGSSLLNMLVLSVVLSKADSQTISVCSCATNVLQYTTYMLQ